MYLDSHSKLLKGVYAFRHIAFIVVGSCKKVRRKVSQDGKRMILGKTLNFLRKKWITKRTGSCVSLFYVIHEKTHSKESNSNEKEKKKNSK